MREIQAFLGEMYGVDVSPDLISRVTDAVVAEVTGWQGRPLEPMYPVVFFDALRVKVRDEGVVRSKAIYLALAVLPNGTRDILGIWIEQTEGAKFWMKVFTDLKTRGCADILIAVTDGLKGMREALAAVFPATTLQTCIVHLLRHSLDFVKFFAFPHEVRRVMYTTNAIESVNARLRKILKTRGHFPNDEAATLIWLALRHITASWGHKAANDWHLAMNQFAILYEDRFTAPTA